MIPTDLFQATKNFVSYDSESASYIFFWEKTAFHRDSINWMQKIGCVGLTLDKFPLGWAVG